MEKLKLQIDPGPEYKGKKFRVEVPYRDGLVITSEYCPTELVSDKVKLLAAFRGEGLENFMEDCRKQVLAMSKIKEADTLLDLHIAGLMAVVMDHLSHHKNLTWDRLLIYVDCFSLLLKGAGFGEKEIRDIYLRVTQTILDLYADYIYVPESKEEIS